MWRTGFAEIGPVTGGTVNEFLERTSGVQAVPATTRRLKIELIVTKKSGVTDDAVTWADNLSVILTAPDTIKLLSLDPAGRVATSLAGVDVSFTSGQDSVAAPLLYVSATEIGAIVSFEVDGQGKTSVQVGYKGDRSAASALDVVAAAPGIFTQEAPGSGNTAGQIWNEDWSLNSAANPAAKGSAIRRARPGGSKAPRYRVPLSAG